MREMKTDFSVRKAAMQRAVDTGLFDRLRQKWKVLMLKPLKFGPELELPVWMMADGQDSTPQQRFDALRGKLERLFRRFYKPEIQAGDFTGIKLTFKKVRAPLCCGSSCDCCPLAYNAKKTADGLASPRMNRPGTP